MFHNRTDAGRQLASLLNRFAHRDDVLVLALPRGGVPVAAEVARSLGAPLDVFLVRKLGAPSQKELAVGAIATGGVRVLNERVVRDLNISEDELNAIAEVEGRELTRRERAYRGHRPPPDLLHKTVILVDDGLATGATMRAAVRAVRRQGPKRVVVAVPVGAPDTCREMANEADEVICAFQPEGFQAVGYAYEEFQQTTDEEVRELLR